MIAPESAIPIQRSQTTAFIKFLIDQLAGQWLASPLGPPQKGGESGITEKFSGPRNAGQSLTGPDQMLFFSLGMGSHPVR
jgi:hypothetical protein